MSGCFIQTTSAPHATISIPAAIPNLLTMAKRFERAHRPLPTSRASANASERSSSTSGEFACSAKSAQSSYTRCQAAALRVSAANHAESSEQLSRSCSASQTRQVAACVRRDVSLSLMPIPLGQMDHSLYDVLLDGALSYTVKGSDILLFHILETEQDKNFAGQLAQFVQGT